MEQRPNCSEPERSIGIDTVPREHAQTEFLVRALLGPAALPPQIPSGRLLMRYAGHKPLADDVPRRHDDPAREGRFQDVVPHAFRYVPRARATRIPRISRQNYSAEQTHQRPPRRHSAHSSPRARPRGSTPTALALSPDAILSAA